MTVEDTRQTTGRRRHQRIAVEMGAEIVTDEGRFTARTRDLSRGGICFFLFRPLPVGSSFTAELSLVLGENTVSEPLVLRGRVVWCTVVTEGHQIGAVFVDIEGKTKKYLETFLQVLSEGVDQQWMENREGGQGAGSTG